VKFAKLVFWIAGIWGLITLTPLYFLFDSIGLSAPPPITHPEFYYGFTGVAIAWQFAFFVIGSAPARFRSMMIPAIFEKLAWVLTLVALYLQNRIGPAQALSSVPDCVLGVLFTMAFVKAKPA
jgi:hypothetical protein